MSAAGPWAHDLSSDYETVQLREEKVDTDYYLVKLPTCRPFQYLFSSFSHMQSCRLHYTEVTSVTAALIIHAKLTHSSVGAICLKSHEQSPRWSIPTAPTRRYV
uniref:Uncharacterized protein n=1 Tax=Hyaloperonospora arabidopsidis (strain Emoy2) TaxID=559515 RepID=M4BAG7_HYAAE